MSSELKFEFDNVSRKYLDMETGSLEGSNMRTFVEKYTAYYKWFLTGLLLALLVAFIYLRYAVRYYKTSTIVLIDNKEDGGLSSELSAFQDLGLMANQTSSLETEITVLRSRTLMQTVLKNLDLTISYQHKGRLNDAEYYSKLAPVKVIFLQKDSMFYNRDTSFSIDILSKERFALINGDGRSLGEKKFGERIPSKMGDFIVEQQTGKEVKTLETVIVSLTPLKVLANSYSGKLIVEPESKKSKALKLSLTDPVKRKSEDILDNLIEQYNQNSTDDQALITKNTDDFINQRITDISSDLVDVDKGIEIYKIENKLTDIDYEAGLILTTNTEVEKKIVDLSSQIKVIDYINDYMKNNTNGLIPENLGIKDEAASQNTKIYNQLVLERNRIITSSSAMNPAVIRMTDQISSLRENISKSLTNLRKSLSLSLDEVRSQEIRLKSRRSQAPTQEREFQDIKRKQTIIESLYLYLLQKREENAIKMAATTHVAKVIDRADSDMEPSSPKKVVTYLIASLLGLWLPFVLITIKFSMDNKVHKTEDVASLMNAPILGDIPSTGSDKKFLLNENDNSIVAESFRMLRTNIDFLLPVNKKGGKTVFITSTVGNEGKTFIAINLAISIALINKKVLLIGADIRKPKISEYMGLTMDKGLTQFLRDYKLEVPQILDSSKQKNLDVISTGPIPPNPSELLTNGRIKEIIAYGREHYDYVIIDTPPVDIVTDTLLLSGLADLFIYVVRADYLDKRLLSIPKKLFDDKRLPNMAILINDTDYKKKGYGYGYGYGYTKTKKPWYKRFNV